MWKNENKCVESSGIDEVKQIAKTFDIDDINLINRESRGNKSIAAKSFHWRILIDEEVQGRSAALGHLVRLAEAKKCADPVLSDETL